MAVTWFSKKGNTINDSDYETERKLIYLNQISVDEEYADSLVGFLSFTGSDYMSLYFQKDKTT